MQCPNCGAQANGKFCEYCGSEMPRIAPETVNNDNSNTTIINNYYQSSPITTVRPENKQSFNNRSKHKSEIPFWRKNWFIILMCLFVPYIGVFFLWATKKPANKNARSLITVFLVFYSIGIFVNSNSGDESENQEENNSVWLDGYTDISDFDYYIDGNEIFLTDFNSSKKKVRINSTYEIDSNTYNVVSLDSVFTLDNVTSVIIPEGVRSVASNEFNSCGVKFLYLPSTLQNIESESFWRYFHDVEKIYYGGSEEQWNQLCTIERSRIDVNQIIYDANPDDLK